VHPRGSAQAGSLTQDQVSPFAARAEGEEMKACDLTNHQIEASLQNIRWGADEDDDGNDIDS
jgi:hypothetical protein